MVSVRRRSETRTFGVLTHLARKRRNNWNDVPLPTRKDTGSTPWNLGRPFIATNGDTLSRSEGEWRTDRGPATFSFDACDRLKEPPARRQEAIANADILNDVV